MRKLLVYHILILLVLLSLFSSCTIVKKLAGADLDPDRFAKARLAKMMEIRLTQSNKMIKRLSEDKAIDDNDVNVFLRESMLGNLIKQYEGSRGQLDENTNFVVYKTELELKGGSALAFLHLNAYNEKYDVNVNLALDCIITFEVIGDELFMEIEPFNILPIVSAGGMLSGTEEIIKNLININLGTIGEKFPELKLPVKFDNYFKINKIEENVRDRINLDIKSPERQIDYELRIADILILDKIAYIGLSLEKVEVK